MIVWELFLTFARIGLFTFGGGYAMVSIIEDICVSQKKWITMDEMMDVVVIAESTPGPIAINCSTFVGYRQGGLPGAIAATVGVVVPSFVIIFAIAGILDSLLQIPLVYGAFQGIKCAVGVLILNAGVKMGKKLPKAALPRAIVLCAFCAMVAVDLLALNVSTIVLMLSGGFVSLAICLAKGGKA